MHSRAYLLQTLQRLKDPSEKKTLALLLISKAPQIFGAPDFSASGAPLPADARLRSCVRLCGHKASVLSLAASTDGAEVWTGGSHGALLAFEARKCRFSRLLPAAPGAVTRIVAAGPYMWLLVPEAARVEVRSSGTGACMLTLPLPAGAPGACCRDAAGGDVWVGLGCELVRYDAQLLVEQERCSLPAAVTALVALEGGGLWAACADRVLREVRAGAVVREIAGLERVPSQLVRGPADLVAVASSSGAVVHIYDSKQGTRKHSLMHDNRVCSVLVVGSELWAVTWDQQMYIWDLHTGLLLGGTPTDHTQFVCDMALLYNTKVQAHQVWSASGDRSVLVSNLCQSTLKPEAQL